VSSREIVAYLILSAGLLAMPIGAFGLLDALGAERPARVRRTVVLIGLYAVGVLLCSFSLVLAGRWYLGAVLALMLAPAETALRRAGALRRRANLDNFR
jgi:hypothetical protein